MPIAAIILSIVTSVLLLISGIGKLAGQASQLATLETVGIPVKWAPWLAFLEFAAAAGLIVGLFWQPIGIAAGIGAVLYFGGAIASHLLKRDYHVLGGTMMIALAVATFVVGLFSL
jgi:uncharacterized membrane protein YphA (DoxX/SURF4 family)